MTVKKNKSILIIENDNRILNALQSKLKEAGYLTISSVDGFEGYERTKKEMPDLILTEDRLPVMSGLKLSRIIKFDERYSKIPIVLMGGKEALSDIDPNAYGIDKVITKPFRFGDLKSVISDVLNKEVENG